ncbi:uncharacterized protein LOC123322078 [Coccinella septempunctata]|uniref:uncharacterized protein LOC123322078 n=1 Tax=Coccinella septempunctata TaxID=41139 RepID=UPI001D077BB8|nr:uncharacterized protein LOC123322078 [Coccinella septempunctata]
MMAESHTNSTDFHTSIFREIYKNSWLKKVSSNSKKKKERLWIVFCIHDDVNAFLEAYSDNKSAILHKPCQFFSLNETQHVTSSICPINEEYEFCITLLDQIIKLAAPSQDLMIEWVEVLRTKLKEMKILCPIENLYTKLPEPKNGLPLLSTRDPNSPLPPPPVGTRSDLTRMINDAPGTSGRSRNLNTTPRWRSESTSSCDSFSSPQNTQENEVFNFENLNRLLETPPLSAPASFNHYEPVFQASSSPGPSTRPEIDFQNRPVANSYTRFLMPPPRPYRTLREQQVQQLQNEMKHPGGVRLQLRRRDCLNAIAFVDAYESVWICGWKQKEHPMLYNALHIGDQVLNVEGVVVKTAYQVRRILKSHSAIYINIVIKRIPFGRVFVIHRETEGQSLGIIQENNTAVIKTVQAGSLAAKHGLPCGAMTCDGTAFTNWVLTEINGRPLNLYFKKNQVRDRLNAVGRDISILVQPLDLVKQFKKELKSIRNYKEYLLQ